MLYNHALAATDSLYRSLKMPADSRAEIDTAESGDIVALIGIDCAASRLFQRQPSTSTLEIMFIPSRLKVSLTPEAGLTRQDSKALASGSCNEDPPSCLQRRRDEREIITPGMGELHRDIYDVERIRPRNARSIWGWRRPKVSSASRPTRKSIQLQHKSDCGGGHMPTLLAGVRADSLATTDAEGRS